MTNFKGSIILRGTYTGSSKAFPMTDKFLGQPVLQLKPYTVEVLKILFNLMTRAIVNVTERWPNPLTGHKIAERHTYI